jgi:hypothetical protein
MDEESKALLVEIRDSLKSIDDRLAKWTSTGTGISSLATKLETAIRDVATSVANAARSANDALKRQKDR